MKVLIIGKIWPEPTSSAAGKRTIDVIESLLTADWELHFACVAQKSEYSYDLEKSFPIITHSIKLNDSTFDVWITELSPDIVIFDRYMTEEQFGWRVEKALPAALRVIDTSDLHFLRQARHENLKTGEPINYYNQIACREIASILRSDLSLIISEFEYVFLTENFPITESLVAYWPFFLDTPNRNTKGFEERKNFAMIGSFLHEPNWDAVKYCYDSIWPIINKALPNSELHVYGSYPPAKATQLNSKKKNFLVKGRASDAIETLKNYRLNLAPLRFGAGLKGKLFDAFVAGTPSIATPIAIEGINGDLPWGSDICDSSTTFANTAIQLYSNESHWRNAQDSGYTVLNERFPKTRWIDELPRLLQTAISSKNENRAKNFVGQMLLHHTNRSTEYMSRWIELKSKKSVPESPIQ